MSDTLLLQRSTVSKDHGVRGLVKRGVVPPDARRHCDHVVGLVEGVRPAAEDRRGGADALARVTYSRGLDPVRPWTKSRVSSSTSKATLANPDAMCVDMATPCNRHVVDIASQAKPLGRVAVAPLPVPYRRHRRRHWPTSMQCRRHVDNMQPPRRRHCMASHASL